MWEWNDAVIGSIRGLRGGSWANLVNDLQSSVRGFDGGPTSGDNLVGFRVASVPEPSAALLVLMGVGALYFWKRRKKYSSGFDGRIDQARSAGGSGQVV